MKEFWRYFKHNTGSWETDGQTACTCYAYRAVKKTQQRRREATVVYRWIWRHCTLLWSSSECVLHFRWQTPDTLWDIAWRCGILHRHHDETPRSYTPCATHSRIHSELHGCRIASRSRVASRLQRLQFLNWNNFRRSLEVISDRSYHVSI